GFRFVSHIKVRKFSMPEVMKNFYKFSGCRGVIRRNISDTTIGYIPASDQHEGVTVVTHFCDDAFIHVFSKHDGTVNQLKAIAPITVEALYALLARSAREERYVVSVFSRRGFDPDEERVVKVAMIDWKDGFECVETDQVRSSAGETTCYGVCYVF